MAFPRRHAPFLIILGLLAPLMLAFAANEGLSSMADDSVSYLTLARFFSGDAGTLLSPSAHRHGHFPPLFPMLLAATGGATRYAGAQVLVASFAIASIVLLYGYVAAQLGRATPALWVVATLALAPTAWVSIKSTLSESTFLFFTLACLALYEWRLARSEKGSWVAWALLGLLLAAACLTRLAGAFLVLAYSAHAVVRLTRSASPPRTLMLLPVVIAVAALALWVIARPVQPDDGYARAGADTLRAWVEDPVRMLEVCARNLFGGWVASFAVDSTAPASVRLAFGTLAVFALAGTVRRLLANRLDAWFVLLALASALNLAVFSEENARRILYPVVPLLIFHATAGVEVLTGRLPSRQSRSLVTWCLAAAPLLLTLPATALVAERAMDRTPLAPDGRYPASSLVDSYRAVDARQASHHAAMTAAVIHGLERLATSTPAGSRVMWVRPEYVALLGQREPVPLYYGWDAGALAEAIRASRTTHVVWSVVVKTDLSRNRPDARAHLAALRTVGDYASPEYVVRNAVTGSEDFVVMRVDAERLDGYLRN